jgi:arylsulfatase A-like enzyme
VRWPLTQETPGGFNLNWDHHDYMYNKGSCGTVRNAAGGEGRYGIGSWVMMGSTDQAFAALLDDLDQRGLLDETLVCFVTEFGRTPRLNRFQGRDHWTNAYSLVFAGAGVPGGQVIGRSDKDGGYVTDQPHTPEDYAMSLYEKLGIDRARPLYTASHRPIFFGHAGEPIRELF